MVSKPSSAWYLVPLFLGLLGGLLGYIAVKDEDRNMANNLLFIGIITTVIGLVLFWSLEAYIMSRLLDLFY